MIDWSRYDAESNRLVDENADLDDWIDLAEREGIVNPELFLHAFVVVAGVMEAEAKRRGDARNVGVPQLGSLLVGLRIGRMEAMRALEQTEGSKGDEDRSG